MILTESQLKDFAQNPKRSIQKSLALASFSALPKVTRTVFLSHKHDDYQNVKWARELLKNYNVHVYIDWLDENMPKVTSAETAEKLKDTIKKSNKFIFLASERAIASQWCNWELGLGDVYKYSKDIALLPVKYDDSGYKGNEYLNIYPYVQYQNGMNKSENGRIIEENFYIFYPKDNIIVPLPEWLNR